MHILIHQYDLIKQRRETLFAYCESFAPPHFVHKHENFGSRSISFLLVHTAKTYNFWLGHFPKVSHASLPETEEYGTVGEVRGIYQTIDALTEAFLTRFDPKLEEPITNKISSRNIDVAITPLQLFTHVITHEYHHKGQILSMSRQLGYKPIDTDIIRFD